MSEQPISATGERPTDVERALRAVQTADNALKAAVDSLVLAYGRSSDLDASERGDDGQVGPETVEHWHKMLDPNPAGVKWECFKGDSGVAGSGYFADGSRMSIVPWFREEIENSRYWEPIPGKPEAVRKWEEGHDA